MNIINYLNNNTIVNSGLSEDTITFLKSDIEHLKNKILEIEKVCIEDSKNATYSEKCAYNSILQKLKEF